MKPSEQIFQLATKRAHARGLIDESGGTVDQADMFQALLDWLDAETERNKEPEPPKRVTGVPLPSHPGTKGTAQ